MSLLPNGFRFYGGATVMRLSDANGVPWMSCCAWNPAGVFGFRIFKGADLVEVPLTPFCTGKGSMNLAGWWVAASDNNTWFNGQIPGFAPVVAGHDARVDALISQLGELGQKITEIETALGNVGAIDPKDRVALDRLRAFLML